MILLVEDAQNIISNLTFALENEGLNVIVATNIKKAINLINKENIELIILDLTLPDGNGLDLYEKEIKRKNIPTIILTVIDEENIVVNSLNKGVDEYMTKPFSTKELVARINRIFLKRQKKNILEVKDIKFDIDKMIVYKDNKVVNLSSLELKILHILFLNINKVVTRSFLLDKIWEYTGNDVEEHTLTVYLNRIRDKLDSDIILTIKGVGYRIDAK